MPANTGCSYRLALCGPDGAGDEQGRMRPHMRFFINHEQTFDTASALKPTDEIQIVQALSGG